MNPKGVNLQSGQVPPGCPVVAVVSNDWMRRLDWLAGVQVAAYRLMARLQNIQQLVPAGSDLLLWNEDDDGPDRSWRSGAVTVARAAGYRVHYGAERWDQWERYDAALAARCDVVDYHVNVDAGQSAPTTAFGKPVWVTEVETSPAAPRWDLLLAAMRASALPCFAWGASPSRADVNDHPDVIAAIAAMSYSKSSNGATGDIGMADDTGAKLDQLLAQNAHIAQALYDLAKRAGETDATASETELQDAKAHINALNPGKFTF